MSARAGMLYGVLAAIVGTIVTMTARVTVERQRGRGKVARRLPDGPIIVVSNHTSYADGVLLALACRRLGRSLRLLATSGLFEVPILGGVQWNKIFHAMFATPIQPRNESRSPRIRVAKIATSATLSLSTGATREAGPRCNARK